MLALPPSVTDPMNIGSSDEILSQFDNEVGGSVTLDAIDQLNTHAPIFVVAFLVTLLITPIARRVALRAGVVDRPDGDRKVHRLPTPYLGGIAVFAGVIVAIGLSYFTWQTSVKTSAPVPVAIVIGLFAITFTGLADDIWGWDPRLKIAGQLVAAAALAISDVGVRVADGLLSPICGKSDKLLLGLEFLSQSGLTNADLYYWVGTAIIAIFVIGGCNAANLIDGLDGLLSGVTAIIAVGLLAISLLMLANPGSVEPSQAEARIVLSLALLGAVLGFLPHNFNPASIFLGDSGSLLLGYLCVVIILMFGETGQTHLVFAGLIVFGVPIMDAILAIVRRKLAGMSMSNADRNHLHHQLLRTTNSVKRSVFIMYGIAFIFAVIGVALASLVMLTDLRVRFVYVIALVLGGFVAVIAVKEAQRKRLLAAVEEAEKRKGRKIEPPASHSSRAG